MTRALRSRHPAPIRRKPTSGLLAGRACVAVRTAAEQRRTGLEEHFRWDVLTLTVRLAIVLKTNICSLIELCDMETGKYVVRR